MSKFQKATKKKARGRLAFVGPSGSGKTITALITGKQLGDKMAVIDTERGSASKYSDQFEFDVLDLETFSPRTYIEAIKSAEREGYDVIVIDSLSHAREGTGGVLEMADKVAARSSSKNTFNAWKEVTPEHKDLIETILQSKCHVIVTMRVKTEYIIEEDPRGKKVPRKVGLAPVQRAGVEYDFDVVADMDQEHRLVVSKSRCSALADYVKVKPGPEFGQKFAEWLSDGVDVPAPTAPSPPTSATDNYDLALHQIQSAGTVEELAEVKTQLTAFRDDGLITKAQYDALGGEYMNRKKELTASA